MKEKLKEFYSDYKFYIYPVVVTVCSLILIVFVIFPQFMGFLDSRIAYDTIIAKGHAMEVKAQELSTVDATAIKRDIDIVLEVLPIDKDFPKVIGMAQLLTSKYLYNLTSLQFANTLVEGGGKETPTFLVKMGITGSRDSLPLFLKELENTVPLSKIEAMEIASTSDDSTVNVIITLNVYYSNIPDTLGSVEAPLPQISNEEEALLSKYSSLVQTTGNVSSPTSAIGKSNPFE